MAVSAGPETALMRLARERGLTALTLGPGGAGTLLDALGAEQPAVDAAVGLNSESLAAILYTSGTTGRAQGRNAQPRQSALQRAFADHSLAVH
jgi:acyl-coenzyme A synthetase/AMP-(fatty) acid ligase